MADLLSALSSAIGIVSRLKSLSDKVRDADFKMLLADLTSDLADMKMQLVEVTEENATLKRRLKELESAEGEPCPRCRKRTFTATSTRPHPTFGRLGVSEREYKCSECGFSEKKTAQ